MKVAKFFQNAKGEQTIIQFPNVLLSAWLAVQLVNLLVFKLESQVLSVLGSMLLFGWSYNELTQGESPFRKVLGGLILTVVVISVFVRWQ